MHELTKSACIQRLNGIEGQGRGLARMVEEGRYCIDIVTQLSAARAALRTGRISAEEMVAMVFLLLGAGSKPIPTSSAVQLTS